MENTIVILAAGKGSRMKSALPKVLQPLAGKPLLSHVLATAQLLSEQIITVIGHGAAKVQDTYQTMPTLEWVLQEQQLGTGHAVKQVLPHIKGDISLILYGDVPLISPSTLKTLIEKAQASAIALLTIHLENPQGYGRIVRDNNGAIIAIVEEKDANDEHKRITEVNTGIIAIKTEVLKKLIPLVGNNNAQQEYYLTDIVSLATQQQIAIDCVITEDNTEVQGINDKVQLAQLERAYQYQQAIKLQEQGATIIDPHRFDLRGELSIGEDVSIDVNCIFAGKVILGNNVSIAANCIIGEEGHTVTIANNVSIKAFSIIEDAEIACDCVIGPYARLRPGTTLASSAKIGNFVETKNANIGEGSKVNHLTYIGDAIIGKKVNIGAGTITCNYDGVNKAITTIKDNAFIGSNSSLVAPVTIGKNATVGAGSTINKNVEDDILAVARAKQNNIDGWQRPRKK